MRTFLRHITLCFLLTISVASRAQFNTDRITAIGRNALYFDDYVLSIQYFNQVIKLKPYLAEPYLYRAIAKIQLSDYTGALRDCDACIHNAPFLPGAYYTRGFVHRQLGNYKEAEQDFTEALHFAPGNKTYILLRADVRAQQEAYDLALGDVEYLLRREPQGASLHFEKGIITLQKKDTLGARQSFAQSCQYEPQNAGYWSALGLTDLMMDSTEAALKELTQAINMGSRWAGDYINRGIIYYRQHNYRGAVADYDKAVELSPNDAGIYYNRGMLRQELGDGNRAIQDFTRAIDLDPDRTEMRYQRGTAYLALRQYEEAVADFQALIDRYPYFLPSYYLAAQAKTAMGDTKGAYLYQSKAAELEKNKEKLRQQQINTQNQLAESQPTKRDYRKEFSSTAAQNGEANQEESKYQSASRGAVQNRYTDLVSQGNIVLSYYAGNDELRRTNYSHVQLDRLNRMHILPSPIRLTYQEVALTPELISVHFDQIYQLSSRIEQQPAADVMPRLLMARAVEFALVQDYTSAIEDCNIALQLLPTASQNNDPQIQAMQVMLYFCRANWRYKQLEYQRSTGELAEEETTKLKLRFEMLMRDYDQVILLQPDFVFAYYNKANILCIQRDYEAAISLYTSAIATDPDFAEAYYNRGLTHLFLNRHDEGIDDLSRSGELGIYQAYNLLTRFQ